MITTPLRKQLHLVAQTTQNGTFQRNGTQVSQNPAVTHFETQLAGDGDDQSRYSLAYVC